MMSFIVISSKIRKIYNLNGNNPLQLLVINSNIEDTQLERKVS